MVKRGKYWQENAFKYNNSPFLLEYPIKLSDEILRGVQKTGKRIYRRKQLKYILGIYFSMMVQLIRETRVPIRFDFGTLGYMRATINPNVCYLGVLPTVNMNSSTNSKCSLIASLLILP